jgi:(p)ppGpp synthase/HD superfamily hydrolase
VCGNLSNFRKQPEKWIGVSWEDAIERDFLTQVLVDTVNKPGVLAEVAAMMGDNGSNIESVSVISRDEDTSSLTFQIKVHDRVHLARIMRAVKSMSNVNRVTRDCA